MQVTGTGKPLAQEYPEAAGLERHVYEVLRELRCAPFLPAYVQVSRISGRLRAASHHPCPPMHATCVRCAVCCIGLAGACCLEASILKNALCQVTHLLCSPAHKLLC